MQIFSALRRTAAAVFLTLVAATFSSAVETHIWEQSDQGDFTRGTPKHLAIRSDGHVYLSPQFKELDSTTVPYLWAIAQDSKGALYYAGGAPTGATAKIFVRGTDGKCKVFAELPGLEIHALAVDREDRLYAAVLPDAKVYRIDKSGKSQIFFDPKAKYVWAMAFDHSGDLFVATGDSGLIYKVSPEGKGSEFARTNEAHARSMIMDQSGNLIVGTEPNGLVMRISPQGQSFVLFQTAKREVTAVAEYDGAIYASSVGNRPATVSGPAPVLPANPGPVTGTGAPRVGTAPPVVPPPVGSLTATVTGGSEFYRIGKDGSAERLWQSSSDLIYAIAFGASGRPILGTGNKGVIYRVDTDELATQLLDAPPTQVTALLQGKNGIIYAATGNVGNLYSIGPGLESSGTLESDVLDANGFAQWGKAHLTSTLHGGSINLEVRSGNVNDPQHEWSPWTPVAVSQLGGEVKAPAARFLQYRLTFNRGESEESPDLTAVDIPYLPKNTAPKVRLIEVAPFNYRQSPSNSSLERSLMASGSPNSISVPAVGQKRSAASSSPIEAASAATLQYSKGYVTVRWSASDADGDSLNFKAEIKEKNDASWRLLKDKLQDRYFAFDSAAFPDGNYLVRITASDAPGNTPDGALNSSLESDPFVIDNTPPEIVNVKVGSNASRQVISFTAKDALSWIDKAEYSVDGGDWTVLEPVNKVSDSQELNYQLPMAGNQMIAVRVFDEDDNVIVRQFPPKQ